MCFARKRPTRTLENKTLRTNSTRQMDKIDRVKLDSLPLEYMGIIMR